MTPCFFFCQQTPGHSVAWKGHNLHDMSVFRNRQLDLSHTIRSLSFGAAYPGQKNPLDGTVKSLPAEQSMGQHEYFIKLVPTTYKKARGRSLKTNQVCATEHVPCCLAGGVRCLRLLACVLIVCCILPQRALNVSCRLLTAVLLGVALPVVRACCFSPRFYLFLATVFGDRVLQAERPQQGRAAAPWGFCVL